MIHPTPSRTSKISVSATVRLPPWAPIGRQRPKLREATAGRQARRERRVVRPARTSGVADATAARSAAVGPSSVRRASRPGTEGPGALPTRTHRDRGSERSRLPERQLLSSSCRIIEEFRLQELRSGRHVTLAWHAEVEQSFNLAAN